MCFQLMFVWSIEKLKIDLVSYECEAEGFVEELLDRTSTFKKMVLHPRIEVRNCEKEKVRRALKLAKKYSLIVQSITAEVLIEPKIRIIE